MPACAPALSPVEVAGLGVGVEVVVEVELVEDVVLEGVAVKEEDVDEGVTSLSLVMLK